MRSMLRLSMVVTVWLGCAGPAAADPLVWGRLSRPAEGFLVEMPQPVVARPTEVASGIRPLVTRAVTYEHAGEDFILAVGVQENRRVVSLDRAVEASFAGLGCAEQAKPELIAVQGAAARELKGQRCLGSDYSACLRQLVRGRMMYQVLAIYRSPQEAEARRFLDSFRLTGERRN